MLLTLSDILRFETGMLTIFSPPVAMSIYATTLDTIPSDARKQVTLRLFLGVALVLVGAAWAGQILLNLL
jgi:small neutral amino acid transporter SnatA (MarC family)